MPPPASPPKPAAKPEIVPRSNTSVSGGISNNNQNNNKHKTKDDTSEHNAKNLDCVDEGLAMLRRQPSIKDRRKVSFHVNFLRARCVSQVIVVTLWVIGPWLIFEELHHTFHISYQIISN